MPGNIATAAATPRIRGRRLQRRRHAFLTAHPFCRQCLEASGRIMAAVEVDHIVPLFKGGADAWENLQGLCQECHREKTAADLGHKPKGADVSGWPTDPRHPWNTGADDQRMPCATRSEAAPPES